MAEEHEPYEDDPGNPWILNRMIELSERVFATNSSANLAIIIGVIIIGIVFVGISALVTRGAAPAAVIQSIQSTGN